MSNKKFKVTYVWTHSIEVECENGSQAHQLAELWINETAPAIAHDTEWSIDDEQGNELDQQGNPL